MNDKAAHSERNTHDIDTATGICGCHGFSRFQDGALMPAYSFKQQFVPFVESGAKTHTIRGKRKHRPQPGQTFYGYYAMRTKQCRKLLQSTITHVQDIRIEVEKLYCDYIDGEHVTLTHPRILIDGETLAEDEMEALARKDGFSDLRAMMMFWPKEVLPFAGDLIHWRKP